MTWNNKLLAVGLVALLQTAALAWMVGDRVRLIKTGREIVLPVVPVDPRDLFRGDFVRLGYEISQLGPGSPKPADGRTGLAQPYYVVVQKQADGTWKRQRDGLELPSGVGPDEVVIKGKIGGGDWFGGGFWNRPTFGIESYFVPEGTGKELEKAAREKRMSAVIAVDAAGKAAIKGLMVDGKVQYEEPLL